MIDIKTVIRFLSFFLVIGLLIWMMKSEWFSVLHSQDMEAIKDFFEEQWEITLLVTFILMTFQNLLTVLPLALIVTVNIWFYDLFAGFAWSWGTSVLASLIAFLLYRYWLQTVVSKKIKKYKTIQEKIEKNGFTYVLFARLIPIIPSSFINGAAGVSSITLPKYVMATTIGNGIFIFLLSLLVEGLLTSEMEVNILIILSFIFLISLWGIRKNKRKNKKQEKMI